MQTNEFRVRPVQRFQLTHYQEDGQNGSCRTVGEFQSVEAAEEVGVALQALVPGSALTTIEGRQASYPPKALAAAMATRQQDDAGRCAPLEYVVVQRGFGIDARAFYAEDEAAARRLKGQAEANFGGAFFIFTRPKISEAEEALAALDASRPA